MEVEGSFITQKQLDILKKIRVQYMKEITLKSWSVISELGNFNRRIFDLAISGYTEVFADEEDLDVYNAVTDMKDKLVKEYGNVLTDDEIDRAIYDNFDD